MEGLENCGVNERDSTDGAREWDRGCNDSMDGGE